ncbi:hypothetical protein PPROV_000955700 [Pycnococcus provasolii]|uniref:Integrin alpha beta-propellor repeat protein n=1 Tax=Pycnococcus provasolii TaxID=41880 RepID=A0A830HTM6_9CHLO|nr:hypothetical protein PPROV_000955700 [Pycnococcus provasolii]
MTVTLILLPLLALTTFTAPVVRAQGSERMTFQQVQKVVASDGETDFNFGSDNFGRVLEVSQDGLTMVVGAPNEDTGGSNAGAAYVFTRGVPSGNWTEVMKLQASVRRAKDYFGWSVSTSADGSTVVVGATGSDGGSVYVFTRGGGASGTNYTQVARLQASDKRSWDQFGYSVSTSADGSTVVVGAHKEDTGGWNAGAAYVFTRGGAAGSSGSYTQVAKLQASDKQTKDQFGYSVLTSADGSTVVVGAPYEDTGGYDAGAAYVFTRGVPSGNWTEVMKLQASVRRAKDYFGWSVSTSADGSTVVVGATGSDGGSVYVFTRGGGASGTNYTEVAKLMASDKQAWDQFGWSVSTSADGSTVVVGAYDEDTGGSGAGAAYVFTRGGAGGCTSYTQVAKVQASDKQANDHFGRSVSISGDGLTIAAGATQESELRTQDVPNSGAAYIFAAPPPPPPPPTTTTTTTTTPASTTTAAPMLPPASYSQVQKVFASDGETDFNFGSDNFGRVLEVSQDGLTMVVGAKGEDTGGSNAGAAYLYTRAVPSGNWTEVKKLQASDKQAGDSFGYSVSTSADGSTVVVAAPGTSGLGAAYVFTRGGGASGTNYTEVAKLMASDKRAFTFDMFGQSVSTSADGSTVVVGAPYESTGGFNAGAAYVFTRGVDACGGTSYTEVAKLQASDKQKNDNFGYSVSTSADGSTVVVGAHGEDTGGYDAGAAYVFTRGGAGGGGNYTEVAKLQASDKQSYDRFGISVSTSADGSTVVVAAPDKSGGGAAYVFTRGGGAGGSSSYTQVAKLMASDKQGDNGQFGSSVSTSADGSTVVVGASKDIGWNWNMDSRDAGAAYVFTRGGGASGTSYTQVAMLQASDKQAVDRFGESVSVSGDGLTIAAGKPQELPNSGAAYIFAAAPTPIGGSPGVPTQGAGSRVPVSNAPTLTGLFFAIGISTLLTCYNSGFP